MLLLALPARATVMVPLDVRAMTARADRVVRGVVESQAARLDEHKRIVTDVRVRVSRVYKGSAAAGDVVVITREGGSLGGIGMRVAGAPEFSDGEEVLVFVQARGGATWTVGMAQGKLAVTTGGDGKKRVAQNLAGVQWSGAAGANTATTPRLLEDVEREILGYVAAGH
jgi:hypothetical protein